MKSEKYTQMRKWLGRYQFILKEINARREHLEDFKNDIYNPLKAHIISLPNKSGISDTTLSRVINIRRIFGKMIDEMSLEIKRLHKAKEEIEAAISRLEGAERCIIYHRYILGIMWADMPEYVGYEAAQCHRIEARAIKKLLKMIDINDENDIRLLKHDTK